MISDNMTQVLADADKVVLHARAFFESARSAVRDRVAVSGKFDAALAEKEQRALHAMAWMATVVEALAQTGIWAHRLNDAGTFHTPEQLVLKIGFGEYLTQMVGGISMAPNEIARPADFGLAKEALAFASHDTVSTFITHGNSPENRAELATLISQGSEISNDLFDEELMMVRDMYRRFTDERIQPQAHKWHLNNDLIPDGIVSEMAELGTFGVCIDEDFGGLGLGKLAMCVVTEELSRGWIAAGSLGTRSEIAGELISTGGTSSQKEKWLPKIASGEVLPTAVFTEPDTGSDLGSLRTKATKADTGWTLKGNKTWITHASRSDLMTVLARTEADSKGYSGLSMMLAPKPRGTKNDLFPAEGMSGGEIEVLGYRGMREYELSFDSFHMPEDAVLGDEVGKGFKQLMQTFEGARIQTAARAVGVARNAFELGLRYALDRKQFGKSIVKFPRIADKIAMMAVEVVLSRELTYFAAREKDKDKRCDIEAGMAKLLAARVAWTNADAALQIHGGNGYSMEFEISRVLCDARILNIFEGAAEIQAHVVGRGLVSPRNG